MFGLWGIVYFDGCCIEDFLILVDVIVIFESVSMINCVDYIGVLVIIVDL